MAISQKKPAGDETVHYGPPRKQRQKPKVKMQPPMTPMIDVTFQLLLFFLLTCEFRETEGNIPGTLPSKGNIIQQVEQNPPPEPIQIQVRASADRSSASYEMTGVSVVITSPQELFERLRERQGQLGSDEVPIVILPNEDVPWEFVVQAFNQAVRAKYKKIGFAQQIL